MGSEIGSRQTERHRDSLEILNLVLGCVLEGKRMLVFIGRIHGVRRMGSDECRSDKLLDDNLWGRSGGVACGTQVMELVHVCLDSGNKIGPLHQDKASVGLQGCEIAHGQAEQTHLDGKPVQGK